MEAFMFVIAILFIVFGVLEIILFFKLWGMTNKVSSLDRKIKQKQEKDYNYYMMVGDNENAFHALKKEMVDGILKIDNIYNLNIAKLDNYLKSYSDKAKLTGFELPVHLTDGKAYLEKQQAVHGLAGGFTGKFQIDETVLDKETNKKMNIGKIREGKYICYSGNVYIGEFSESQLGKI